MHSISSMRPTSFRPSQVLVIPLVWWHSGVRIFPARLISATGPLWGGLFSNRLALQVIVHILRLQNKQLICHCCPIQTKYPFFRIIGKTHSYALDCLPSCQYSNRSTTAATWPLLSASNATTSIPSLCTASHTSLLAKHDTLYWSNVHLRSPACY